MCVCVCVPTHAHSLVNDLIFLWYRSTHKGSHMHKHGHTHTHTHTASHISSSSIPLSSFQLCPPFYDSPWICICRYLKHLDGVCYCLHHTGFALSSLCLYIMKKTTTSTNVEVILRHPYSQHYAVQKKYLSLACFEMQNTLEMTNISLNKVCLDFLKKH